MVKSTRDTLPFSKISLPRLMNNTRETCVLSVPTDVKDGGVLKAHRHVVKSTRDTRALF